MADIFISYARSDRERAKTLAEALEELGYGVWWDPKIPPGKTFDEVIEAAIDSAKCVIVLWSKESVKSDWVKTEASEGKRRQILVPALIADVKIPLEFRRIQAADLIDWQKEKSHQGFANLVSAVSEIVGRPPAGELGEDVKPKPSLPITEPPAKPAPKPKPPEPEPIELKLDEPKPSEPKPPVPRHRKPILLIGALVGVALILLVGVLWYTQQRQVKKHTEEQAVPIRPEVTPTTREVPRPSTIFAVPSKKTITNSIGMKFVLIPAGTFKMGSNEGEEDEKPLHKVTITEPFHLQTTEVTQGQYKKVMGNNPSYFRYCGDDCPMETVSWDDAQEFIRRLNEMEGTNKYRLPTEAEWEYACRAGSTTRYSFGDLASEVGDYAWYYSNADDKTHPVAQNKPNAWGLYGMLGNVSEWCQDWKGDYTLGDVTDPKGPSSGQYRVYRGGGWNVLHPVGLRSARRGREKPDYRGKWLGFRVAM